MFDLVTCKLLWSSASMNDPYFKLKPRGPTPPDECCRCAQIDAVYLAHVLSDNPIHCAKCRGEIAPERIGFDDQTTELIAHWNTLFGAMYLLWLDSGTYEGWAESELRSRDGAVNCHGLAAQKALARYIPTTYLWFWNGSRPTSCPTCGNTELSEHGQLLTCERCGVSV
jgi:hypothetical protein